MAVAVHCPITPTTKDIKKAAHLAVFCYDRLMQTVRAKIFRTGLIVRSKRGTINDSNLAQTRKSLERLEKYFPVRKKVKIRAVKKEQFRAEWITVPSSRADKVILYIHGGGFVFYPKFYRDYISRLGEQSDTKVLSLDYSLAPENPYPKALHEAVAAYKWLLGTFASKDIVIAGDSAGGALVLSLLHQIREEKLAYPACAIALSPATDATLKSTSIEANKAKDIFIKKASISYFIDAYFAQTPRDHPIASPLHGSFEGFPPLLIEVDKDEIMYDDSARVVEKAKKAKVDVEFYETQGLWHVHHLYARYIPEARKSIEHLGEYIRRHM